MVRLIVTVLVTFATLVFPQLALCVEYTQKNGHIEASANSCEEIKTEASFIDIWTSKDKTNSERCSSQPLQKRGGKCFLDMSNCLPAIAKAWYGRSTVIGKGKGEMSGPNCFNLALVTAGLSSSMVYADDSEPKLLLQEPLCNAVKPGQTPSPGDIGIITKGGDAIHGFTFVSPDSVWTKNGANAESSYQLESLTELKNTYEKLDGECVECIGVKRGDPSFENCSYCLAKPNYTYYHCQDLKTFLATGPDQLTPDIQSALSKTENIDCLASKMFFEKGALNREGARDLNGALLAIAAVYDHEIKTQPIATPPQTKRDLILALIATRVRSLQVQIEDLRSMTGEKNYTDLQIQVNQLLHR